MRYRLLCGLLAVSSLWAQEGGAAKFDANSQQMQGMEQYIHEAWDTLSRSQTDCKSLADPKLTTKPVLYVPADGEIPASVQALEAQCGISVQRLPKVIAHIHDIDPHDLQQQGLLYLPNKYVVPGGRFNEMYGWDSYFIIRGLVRDGRLDLARGMIENFFYEIEHYGGVLNANRTYYFTRSQPPFLTSMVMSYYEAKPDKEWLRRAYGFAQRDYALWTHDPHLAGDTGLARYFDFGEGPVPEMGDDPTYYSQVSSYLLLHPYGDGAYTTMEAGNAVGPTFTYQVCGATRSEMNADKCAEAQKFRLTQDYYKGDRAMRESGFDISFRFGPFSGSTHHYAPVCLNSLLFKAESDMAQMATALGNTSEAQQWKARAADRKQKMNRYFWNAQKGMFFDYDFMQKKQSSYDYATTFYPLWTGWASAEQAKAVAANLSKFEKPGGIAMSDQITGVQWDLPYGWAPLQLITVEGLRKYGAKADADRVSQEFVSTVLENFGRDKTIREKYNVVTRTTDAQVAVGYKSNVVGFGWTNGVTLELLHGMNAGAKAASASGN